MSVKVHSISKKYGKQLAVNEVSFEAAPGQIVGFLGPNGAGKSTTLKIITGYIPPSAGFAEVCGINVNDAPIEAQKKIGYLPEHNPLYLDMYVHEYLQFVAKVYELQDASTRIAEIIQKTGLSLEQNKQIGQLSKGYRQRVGLAQAMLHNPEVLILDEPTSGLDPNQLVEIRNLIKSIGKEKTVILSSHIMQEVEAICDRVIIINRGKIVANQTTAEIRQMSKSQNRFMVEFDAEVSPEALDAIEGVLTVELKGDKTWEIYATTDSDVQRKLFQFAVDHKCALLTINKQEVKLEDVFRKLTSNV
jgi:ABC-2 type transport system ATP-binding protein